MSNLENLYEVQDIKGAERHGYSVVIDGLVIPKLHMIERGKNIELILDGRFSYLISKELSYLFAKAMATSLAIGADFPSISHGKKEIYGSIVIERKEE